MQNAIGFETGEFFESLDESGKDETSDDQKRKADDEKAPAGDLSNIGVVEFFPVFRSRIEIAQEMHLMKN